MRHQFLLNLKLVILSLIVNFTSCNAPSTTPDWEKERLKGQVNSILSKSYYPHQQDKPYSIQKFVYDEQGYKERKIIYYENGSIHVNSEYKNGFAIDEKQYFSNGNLLSTMEYTYNDAGYVTSEKEIDIDNEVYEILKYEYNEKNQLIVYQSLSDNNEVIRSNSFTYDEKGRIAEKKIDSEFQNIKLVYTYNNKDLLKESYWYDKEGKCFQKVHYKFDEYDNMVQRIWFDQEEKLKRTETFQYVYDVNNNWTEKKEFNDGILVQKIHNEITYF